MNWFSWLAQDELLGDAAQTVRAQTLPPLEQDRLIHDIFFPRQDVPSMKLSEIITKEWRFVSDRREWNTRGRLIPVPTPVRAEMEFIPIESYFTVEEREINEFITRASGEQAIFRRLVGGTIAQRMDELVRSNQRRMEIDALQAWSLGTITVMNPQTGQTYTAAYPTDAARRSVATTAWNNGAVNAWNEFLSWIQDVNDNIPGGVRAVVMRRNDYNEIYKDAPLATVAQGTVNRVISRLEFESLLANTLGFRIQFIIMENWLDVFTTGGVTTQRRRTWPQGIIAAVPARTSVGYMGYAPVVRAYELAGIHPDAKIDVRGMSVYKEVSSNGRMLTTECQVNSFPVLQEDYLATMNTLIPSTATA
jgi:hypothetical protein